MNMFCMKVMYLAFFMAFVASGCGVASQEIVQSADSIVEEADVSNGNDYRNTRFGYRVQVPEGSVLFALTQEQTAVEADEQSDLVFFVENETNFFTIRGVEDVRSPHEWLTQNLNFFYPTGDAAQRVELFAGTQAISLRGNGTSESPAKLIVFQLHGKLIVITYEQDSSSFGAFLSSFGSL
jgi:outer membrane lipoprotein-sorting protein